jgi:L-ascorbate metabolism protein UlaG (beta-lactamase superfamily)
VATFELAQYLQNVHGLENVHPMHIGGEHNFGDFSVKFVPAVHGGGIADLTNGYVTFPAGVVVRIDGYNIYHAGDTGLTYDMKLLGDYDSIDVAFLPIGDNFTMGIKDAVIATAFVKPKIVVPIHYSTWPVIEADPTEFARLVMLENLSTPKILAPGQGIVLK